MAAESKLEAARRSGSLAAVIGVLREEEAARTANVEEERALEQVDVVDASIRLASQLSATGTKDAERRQSLSAVQPGRTVTGRGVAKTVVSREQKLTRAVAWVKSLTPEQRAQFMSSEGQGFDALSERQQEIISDAFVQVENQEYSTPIADFDFEGGSPDVDAIVGDEEEDEAGDSFEALESFDDSFEAVEYEEQS
jgi:hypothetical protein